VAAQSQGDETAPETGPSTAAQTVYKGVVGNLLDAVPLDPENRVQLQRFSAVVSSPLSGHSLAITLGIAAPPLMVIGLLWGLWSANQIQPADTVADRSRAGGSQNAAAAPHSIATQHDVTARARMNATPKLAEDPAAALDRLMSSADTRALATVVGGASGMEPAVPCENCIMPMLYFRPAPDVR
jgi:hypothetical protein